MAKPAPTTVDHVVSLAKRRGFVFQSGEIYGGTRSAWDYAGPLGAEPSTLARAASLERASAGPRAAPRDR